MRKFKFAILGAGNIAEKMASTVIHMPQIIPYGVGSRDLARAKDFAHKYGFAKAFGSYEEMVEDPEIDLVYVATPHSHHFKHSMMSLKHGKHVLCEKSFTTNAAQAQKLTEYARANNLVIAEAIWTRYLPMSKLINELIDSGVIGDVKLLTADLGYLIDHNERIVNPALAGGALLDVGVYALNFASMVFGDKIAKSSSICTLTDTGVDASGNVTLCFEDGKMAVLYFSAVAQTVRQGIVYGNKGTLVVENINNPELIRIYNLDREEIASYSAPDQITGFEYQVESVINAIENGLVECPEMPHSEIIRIMKLMDGFRKEWGVIYPPEIESL